MSEKLNQQNPVPSFENRFNITSNIDEAKRAFINRVDNIIVKNFFLNRKKVNISVYYGRILWAIANEFGEIFDVTNTFAFYHNYIFHRCLKALEISYRILPRKSQKQYLDSIISTLVNDSEVDLGITWQNGIFRPSGAKQLDTVLINETLQWLSQYGYATVLTPFEKGLSHFLDSIDKPALLSDVITDIYESLEAMVKITLKNDNDLSGNKEKFISVLGLSKYYRKMLGDYIEYANEYRHGVQEGVERPSPKRNEVEAFTYMTGLFIRLAIQQIHNQ